MLEQISMHVFAENHGHGEPCSPADVLFHHQEECAAVPNSRGIQSGRQNIWVVYCCAREEWDTRRERPEHLDDVWVRFQPLLPKARCPVSKQLIYHCDSIMFNLLHALTVFVMHVKTPCEIGLLFLPFK